MTEVVQSPAGARAAVPRAATFGGIGSGPGAQAPQGPDFAAIHDSAEFAALRSRFRGFVFPMSALFLVWYLTYVLLAAYAKDFMSTRVVGLVTVGLVFGMLQFASTIAITALYVRWARRQIDPRIAEIRAAAGVDAR
ncbi:DUF485 domain-containing protein [Actinokineospora iranica]|uniref:Uncharacterized membrane protein, DUF485 family n=1 Tax=Actinokineospora iranica TaxID=1271860 RepID=A0A1G6K7W2_9PSEU|nr:DUF485 domain-containing protein [Actinokineospora iranica]SDC27033.1 Uncharacterized membrane protein, DUF485 family [Actinokineospora iranica]